MMNLNHWYFCNLNLNTAPENCADPQHLYMIAQNDTMTSQLQAPPVVANGTLLGNSWSESTTGEKNPEKHFIVPISLGFDAVM